MLDQNYSAIYISLTLLAREYSRLSSLGRFRPKKARDEGKRSYSQVTNLNENFSKPKDETLAHVPHFKTTPGYKLAKTWHPVVV